jgi:glycosyl transferase family 92
VSGGGWERFLAYAAHARSKPTFDVEERDPRLDLARRLSELIAKAAEDPPTLTLDDLRPPDDPFRHRVSFTSVECDQWLNAWARADSTSLARALARFRGADSDVGQRFDRFVDAAAEAAAAGSMEHDPRWALTTASLLNFGLEPHSLPIVTGGLFKGLERRLGWDGAPGPSTPLRDQYAAHLRFAREADRRMRQHGIPVRDMLDAQALIYVCAHHRPLWADDPAPDPPERGQIDPATRPPGRQGPPAPYLSICMMYRDGAEYLREWVEFHRLVGAERFFLYDNGSTDGSNDVLAPYVEEGIVEIRAWPEPFGGGRALPGAYNDCLDRHRHDSRWIAFIDMDEFLFSPSGEPLPKMLAGYESWPGVCVNWALFGTSGHQTMPGGLVIESYGMRADDPELNNKVKLIVDPVRTLEARGPHHFLFREGLPVDENQWPVRGWFTKSVSFSRLRVNHYWSKSEDEWQRKLQLWEARGQRRHSHVFGALKEKMSARLDETIRIYVPALRAKVRKGA